jgi:uncharacterized membrane protein
MKRYLAAYGTCIGVMLLLDGLWIGVLARPWYQQGIGHLMAEQVNVVAATAFYLVYGLGLMAFVVSPAGASRAWRKTLVSGALFGFCAYATYDLTNLATLKNWPVDVSLMDMAWGSVASLSAAAGGKWVFDRSKA